MQTFPEHTPESEPNPAPAGPRHRRVLSSVASSSATGGYASDGSGPASDAELDNGPFPSASRPVGVRQTRSLDILPLSHIDQVGGVEMMCVLPPPPPHHYPFHPMPDLANPSNLTSIKLR